VTLVARPGRAAALVLLVLLAAAAAAPVISRHQPDDLDLANRRAAPSAAHWFGTDELGRDTLSRVLHGARVSLAVGLLAGLMASGIGITIGGVAGYAGGWADSVLMRVTDAMLSVPRLLLLMILGAVLTPSVALLVVLVGLVGWMESARVARAEILSLRAREFVMAARAAGARLPRLLTHHLLVNAAGPLVVAGTLAIARSILLESALSFFGVGVQPPAASWGNMLYQAQTTLSTEPWLALFPGMFIFATVLSVNTLGDALARRRWTTHAIEPGAQVGTTR
jgi:peptide/nickel transport system permease protein